METSPRTPLAQGGSERRIETKIVRQPALPNITLLLSEFALWLAMVAEKRSSASALRKAVIMRRWMLLSGSLLPGRASPGTRLL